MIIQLIGKKKYNYSFDDGKKVAGVKIFGIKEDDDVDDSLEGQETVSFSINGDSAFNKADDYNLGERYFVAVDLGKDNKAKVTGLYPV